MRASPVPFEKTLVLVGGGHAHVEVLRRFAMKPLPGVRLVLVSPSSAAYYSGMLPGFIARRYKLKDITIDLDPLAKKAGAHFYRAHVTRLFSDEKKLEIEGIGLLHYDIVSFDIGSRGEEFPGMRESSNRAIATRPFARLLEGLKAWDQSIALGKKKIAVVGAGAAGFELSLALQSRYLDQVEIQLLQSATSLSQRKLKLLSSRKISVIPNSRVQRISDSGHLLVLSDGREIETDLSLFATGARSSTIFSDAKIANVNGFMIVDSYLRAIDKKEIYGAGDCIHFLEKGLDKAGVFPVRQGPVLYDNIRAALIDNPHAKWMYRPQKKFLRLLNTSDSNAILEYGTIEARSKFFWLLKDWIDRQFMNRYQVTPLPPMASPDCGGCGSKLASDSLRQALKSLSISAGDDVAIRSLSSGTIALSVDHFKNFGLNPFNLGQVAAIHALSDFTAKGLKGKFALANFILEKSNESIAACELELLLRGARNILDQEGIEIVGGQTGLGIETSAGFSIIGEGDSLWKKSGAKSGDAIILTKQLGAGILLAAREQGALSGSCFEELLESMLRSSSSLISTLRKYSVTAATDVTGFGLAGHLSEMLSKDSLYAKLNYSDLPVFSSARELARKGYESRMANQNRRSFSANFSPDPLIYDPQTSGGLLFTLPSLEAERCLAEIMPSWPSARIIGYVVSSLQ